MIHPVHGIKELLEPVLNSMLHLLIYPVTLIYLRRNSLIYIHRYTHPRAPSTYFSSSSSSPRSLIRTVRQWAVQRAAHGCRGCGAQGCSKGHSPGCSQGCAIGCAIGCARTRWIHRWFNRHDKDGELHGEYHGSVYLLNSLGNCSVSDLLS